MFVNPFFTEIFPLPFILHLFGKAHQVMYCCFGSVIEYDCAAETTEHLALVAFDQLYIMRFFLLEISIKG